VQSLLTSYLLFSSGKMKDRRTNIVMQAGGLIVLSTLIVKIPKKPWFFSLEESECRIEHIDVFILAQKK
jgi:hypothetical protein